MSVSIQWCAHNCTGHLGKFEDCTTEALYSSSMVSGHDAETGNVDWRYWVALFRDVTDDEPSWGVEAGEIKIPAGSYLLYTNDRGFVWSAHYVSAEAAQSAFDSIETAYGEWSDDE